MKSPIQEVVAQVVFWSGIGSLPLSIAVFVAAFRLRERWKALPMFALGSIAMTHFLWYFTYLGEGLASRAGEFQPKPWSYFLPMSLAVAAVLAGIGVVLRRRKLNGMDGENRPCAPPPSRDCGARPERED